MRIIIILLLSMSGSASAQQILKVAQPVWAGIAQHERDVIQQQYVVDLVSAETFGTIIDNQGVDESSPGSTAGSNLGQAVANAAYVDKAFRDGNYSAKGQLGAILLGGLVGAAFDSAPVSRFHYRYTVRLSDGNIRYVDEVGASPFRHPVGICVSLPVITVAADQQLCVQTIQWLRSTYLGTPTPIPEAKSAPHALPAMASFAAEVPRAADVSPDSLVECKINSLAPVRTTAEKCKLTNGTVIQ